jgi:hypothetical protein
MNCIPVLVAGLVGTPCTLLSEEHGAAARQLKRGAGDVTAAVIEDRIVSLKDHTVNARGNSISRYLRPGEIWRTLFTRRSDMATYRRNA